MSLRRSAFRAVRWTTLSTVVRVVLQLLLLVVMARLLRPADFALAALAIAATGLVQMFSDLGVSAAIVQRREVSDRQLESLYWLNLAAGAVLMLLLMAASPLLAIAFAEPRITAVLCATSLSVPILAIGQQLRVQAEKRLDFAGLAMVELAAAGCGFLATLAHALVAPGVFALVSGYLVGAVVGTVLCWKILANGWAPRLRLHWHDVRGFVGFGGYAMANNLVNAVNSQVDVFIGGHMAGTSGLGLYSVPRDMCLRVAMVVNPIITRVSFPVLAMAQEDRERLRSIYLKSLWVTASVNFPLYAALALFAPAWVEVMLGPGWSESAPLLRLLALWGMVRSIGNPVGGLLLATGRVDLSFKWNLAMLALVPAALWFAAGSGLYWMATAMLAIQLAGIVPGWFVLVRPLCGASLGQYVGAIAAPLFATAGAVGVAAIAASAIHVPLAVLAVGMAVGAATYLALSWLFNRAWLDMMLELLRPMLAPAGRRES
jgi:O-antigen/teichoic acid export membrane protein